MGSEEPAPGGGAPGPAQSSSHQAVAAAALGPCWAPPALAVQGDTSPWRGHRPQRRGSLSERRRHSLIEPPQPQSAWAGPEDPGRLGRQHREQASLEHKAGSVPAPQRDPRSGWSVLAWRLGRARGRSGSRWPPCSRTGGASRRHSRAGAPEAAQRSDREARPGHSGPESRAGQAESRMSEPPSEAVQSLQGRPRPGVEAEPRGPSRECRVCSHASSLGETWGLPWSHSPTWRFGGAESTHPHRKLPSGPLHCPPPRRPSQPGLGGTSHVS